MSLVLIKNIRVWNATNIVSKRVKKVLFYTRYRACELTNKI